MQDFVKTMNWRDDRDSHGHGELVSRDSSLPFGWAIAAYCWMLSWLPLWGGHLQLSYQLCRPLAKGNCSFASDAADFRLKLSFRNKDKMTRLFFALSHSATITNRLRRSRTHKLTILSLVIGPIHKFFILRVRIENIRSSTEAVRAWFSFYRCIVWQNDHFRKTSLPNLVTFNALLKLNDWERAMHLFSVMQHLHPGESSRLRWEGERVEIFWNWAALVENERCSPETFPLEPSTLHRGV